MGSFYQKKHKVLPQVIFTELVKKGGMHQPINKKDIS